MCLNEEMKSVFATTKKDRPVVDYHVMIKHGHKRGRIVVVLSGEIWLGKGRKRNEVSVVFVFFIVIVFYPYCSVVALHLICSVLLCFPRFFQNLPPTALLLRSCRKTWHQRVLTSCSAVLTEKIKPYWAKSEWENFNSKKACCKRTMSQGLIVLQSALIPF